MAQNRYTVFQTAGGYCAIAWNDDGVIRFQLPTDSADQTESLMRRRLDRCEAATAPRDVEHAIDLAGRYFGGERIDFSDVRLDLSTQDDFFRNVYAAARRVGWGHTTTYGTIAKELGAGPEAARDVGQAMAKNPVALIIPCHRVLAAGGRIGGFSAPGGSASKIRMLEIEGVRLSASEPKQQSFGF
jgi:methylated-DNA-[protein]-cysteine S-methyltransferase